MTSEAHPARGGGRLWRASRSVSDAPNAAVLRNISPVDVEGTFANARTITGRTTFGIDLSEDEYISDAVAGSVPGASSGIGIRNAAGCIVNAGTITGTVELSLDNLLNASIAGG